MVRGAIYWLWDVPFLLRLPSPAQQKGGIFILIGLWPLKTLLKEPKPLGILEDLAWQTQPHCLLEGLLILGTGCPSHFGSRVNLHSVDLTLTLQYWPGTNISQAPGKKSCSAESTLDQPNHSQSAMGIKVCCLKPLCFGVAGFYIIVAITDQCRPWTHPTPIFSSKAGLKEKVFNQKVLGFKHVEK